MSETTTKAKAAPVKAAEAPADTETDSTPQRRTAAGVAEVKYVGGAGVREIDARDWQLNGVEDQKKTTWNAGNDYTLPGSDFTDAAVALIKPLSEFKIVSE